MKRTISILILVLFMSQVFTGTAYANHGAPARMCEAGFDLHHFMEHDGEHMHQHIGVTQDLNGDGFICMKVLTPNLHLHVDNTIPLPR